MTSATRPIGRAMALLAVLMLLWGTNWPLFHIVLQELPLWTFRAITTGFAAILLVRHCQLALNRNGISQHWLSDRPRLNCRIARFATPTMENCGHFG